MLAFLIGQESLSGQEKDVFTFSSTREAVILASGIGLLAGGLALYFETSPPDPALLHENNLRFPDRLPEKFLPGTKVPSDITSGACVALPLIIPFLGGDDKEWLIDLGMYAESLILVQGLTETAKGLRRRPRPYAYRAESGTLNRSASRSFWSGHTAVAFQGAVFAAWVYEKRHPDSPLVMPLWAGGLSLAGATAVFRVTSGNHFVTDVLAGAAVGALVGWLVPRAHWRPHSGSVRMTAGSNSLGIILSF